VVSHANQLNCDANSVAGVLYLAIEHFINVQLASIAVGSCSPTGVPFDIASGQRMLICRMVAESGYQSVGHAHTEILIVAVHA